MSRLVQSIVVMIAFGSTVFGQSLVSGNWSTNPVPAGWAGWSDTGKPNTFTSQPSIIEPRRPASLNPNVSPAAAFVTFKVEGNSVTGFLGVDNVWELPMKMELGTMDGKVLRFMTIRPVPGRDPLYWLWTAEWSDDNTLLLYRANINVERGGHAPVELPPPSTRWTSTPSLKLHRVK
jgi:hypothetical protein